MTSWFFHVLVLARPWPDCSCAGSTPRLAGAQLSRLTSSSAERHARAAMASRPFPWCCFKQSSEHDPSSAGGPANPMHLSSVTDARPRWTAAEAELAAAGCTSSRSTDPSTAPSTDDPSTAPSTDPPTTAPTAPSPAPPVAPSATRQTAPPPDPSRPFVRVQPSPAEHGDSRRVAVVPCADTAVAVVDDEDDTVQPAVEEFEDGEGSTRCPYRLRVIFGLGSEHVVSLCSHGALHRSKVQLR